RAGRAIERLVRPYCRALPVCFAASSSPYTPPRVSPRRLGTMGFLGVLATRWEALHPIVAGWSACLEARSACVAPVLPTTRFFTAEEDAVIEAGFGVLRPEFPGHDKTSRA